MSVVACRLLPSCGMGSVVAEPGLSYPAACGVLGPQPGSKPASPALEGRFLTTGSQGSPDQQMFYNCFPQELYWSDVDPLRWDPVCGKWNFTPTGWQAHEVQRSVLGPQEEVSDVIKERTKSRNPNFPNSCSILLRPKLLSSFPRGQCPKLLPAQEVGC